MLVMWAAAQDGGAQQAADRRQALRDEERLINKLNRNSHMTSNNTS